MVAFISEYELVTTWHEGGPPSKETKRVLHAFFVFPREEIRAVLPRTDATLVTVSLLRNEYTVDTYDEKIRDQLVQDLADHVRDDDVH